MGRKPITLLNGVRPPIESSFITLSDNSSCVASAVEIFHLAKLDRRQRLPTAARLSDSLIRRNRSIFSAAHIECTPELE